VPVAWSCDGVMLDVADASAFVPATGSVVPAGALYDIPGALKRVRLLVVARCARRVHAKAVSLRYWF